MKESDRIKNKYPNRIPIIVKKKIFISIYSNLLFFKYN